MSESQPIPHTDQPSASRDTVLLTEQTMLRRARVEPEPQTLTNQPEPQSVPQPELPEATLQTAAIETTAPERTEAATLHPATPVAAAAPMSHNPSGDDKPSPGTWNATRPPARRESGLAMSEAANGIDNKTRVVRGVQHPERDDYYQEPVVAWLVVIGGPGLGAFRPVYEGNNAIGRAQSQRIAIDFGDDSISAEEQAYIRYDSTDRGFLFVPNLAKTNVVSLNETKPTTAVRLAPMDVITVGQTQLVFVPFCGPEFDWSELKDIQAPGNA
ncbi:MAG: FHA domain-containing protein [Hyphomicrobiaceae bacterium]